MFRAVGELQGVGLNFLLNSPLPLPRFDWSKCTAGGESNYCTMFYCSPSRLVLVRLCLSARCRSTGDTPKLRWLYRVGSVYEAVRITVLQQTMDTCKLGYFCRLATV